MPVFSRFLFQTILILSFLGGIVPNVWSQSQTVSLNGNWKIIFDPNNEGRKSEWQQKDFSEAQTTSVPGIIQSVIPDYHGVVWFNREFQTPENANQNGRCLLRFMQVYYFSEVWVNGKFIGSHEGGEDPFVFDITDALNQNNSKNQIVVRVIDPTDEPIENFSIETIPRRNGTNRISAGCGANCGGLMDDVDLLVVPAVYLQDVHLIPDPQTGEIAVKILVQNSLQNVVNGKLSLLVFPKSVAECVGKTISSFENIQPGENSIEATVRVANFKLWDINDPNLYEVVVHWDSLTQELNASTEESESNEKAQNSIAKNKETLFCSDQNVIRCGFRDFRFENGYFRLNGKRIYIKCSHSGSDGPITYRIPFEPDLLLKDIIHCKTMGFNMIRYISGMPQRKQLDLCDEIGLMVYEECYAGWCLGDSPFRRERFENATKGMILRDRNHPSVVCWGLLNETTSLPCLIDALDFLPTVQELGPGRIVFYNSGSFDPFAATEFSDSDYSCWRLARTITPFAAFNSKNEDYFFNGTFWKANTFALHPGDMTHEYAVLRWQAPKNDEYQLNARFFDLVRDGQATVDLHIFKESTVLFESFLNLNGQGKETAFDEKIALKKGENIFFVVGLGDGQGFGDTTGIEIKLSDSEGTVFHNVNDFMFEKNPNGAWSYGYLPAGANPNPEKFQLFPLGQEKFHYEPVGRLANPDSMVWQNVLADTHPYQQTPHRAEIIQTLRTHSKGTLPVFLSEYGIGSGVNLARVTRFYERHQATDAMDAQYYRNLLDRFMKDWNDWKLEDSFPSPEAYFDNSLAWMAEQRRYGINAIRSNPRIVAHSVTGTHDQGHSGEGLTTTFRELKPGTIDAMADLFAPLRFCLFVEPVQLYRGDTIRLEAVLVNEDVLPPGTWPVRYLVIGPNNVRIFDKTTTLEIKKPENGEENPFAIPVFSEEIIADGPSGEYYFRATLLEKGAAAGGWERFYLADRNEMPAIHSTYRIWGNDNDLLNRLQKIGINAIPYENSLSQMASDQTSESKNNLTKDQKESSSVIIVGENVQDRSSEAFDQLYNEVRAGTTVLFLSPHIFSDGSSSTAFLPFAENERGKVIRMGQWLYHKDDWSKFHPYFNGLPTGEILDHIYYRQTLPEFTFSDLPIPDEAISGAFNTSFWYEAGLNLAVYSLGQGKIILNSFQIQNNLGTDPVAEHLLRNILFHEELIQNASFEKE
ncbi:MAG: glycoside hydrolase family 2 TIM barrel-domain containing protein [Planctomycetia bacterium]|nr:glycoside hydrolase family 2 TIM barrel-domain containing protein [Planctomycetia bacterium]